MKFLSALFGRKDAKKHQTQPLSGIEVDAPWNVPDTQPESATPVQTPPFEANEAAPAGEMPSALEARGKAKDASVVNIWDLDDDGSAPSTNGEKPLAAAAATDGNARARRNRTRLIGFDKSDGEVVDLFDDAPRVAATGERTEFPVGLLMIVAGPGLGNAFPLKAGMSTLGRGEDQTVALDFGDNAISRSQHAAIVYDAANRSFMLGHGGKANIVRLNQKPVITNETLSDGDKIQLGETTLQLKAICGPDFDWSDADGGEDLDDDVAIA